MLSQVGQRRRKDCDSGRLSARLCQSGSPRTARAGRLSNFPPFCFPSTSPRHHFRLLASSLPSKVCRHTRHRTDTHRVLYDRQDARLVRSGSNETVAHPGSRPYVSLRSCFTSPNVGCYTPSSLAPCARELLEASSKECALTREHVQFRRRAGTPRRFHPRAPRKRCRRHQRAPQELRRPARRLSRRQ